MYTKFIKLIKGTTRKADRMKILFIGDIYGSLGREIIQDQLPKITATYKPHFIIANGENISHGKGINEKYYKFLLEQ